MIFESVRNCSKLVTRDLDVVHDRWTWMLCMIDPSLMHVKSRDASFCSSYTSLNVEFNLKLLNIKLFCFKKPIDVHLHNIFAQLSVVSRKA